MPRDIGPVIAMPGPDGDGHRELLRRREELKIEQARRNRALQLLDPVLPDSPEKRKLASSIEEHESKVEKQIKLLTQNQGKWQKGTGEVIRDILKLAENAAELYEAYQEYPLSDNFKDYGEEKEKAATRRDFRMSLVNQAIALYYRNVIQDLDKLKITDKPEFEEVEHFLQILKAKMRERADLEKAAMEFERQAGLAEFHDAHSREWNQESADHSDSIQNLPDL